MFVVLVGPAGVGKTIAISPLETILRKSRAVAISPNDVTKQGFLDALAESSRGILLDGKPYEYHYLAVIVRDLANFMSKFDNALAGIMTDLFDCPPINAEQKRTHNNGKSIQNPGVSFLMGTTPENLGNTISHELWDTGFMARIILVYSDEKIRVKNLFAKPKDQSDKEAALVAGFAKLATLKGPMEWEPDVQDAYNAFNQDPSVGAPSHNRLHQYVTRRHFHLSKLAMIAALSDASMTVTTEHLSRAFLWLTEAESRMPEIFAAMVSHADGQVFEDMRMALFQMHMRTGGQGLPRSVIFKYLSAKVRSDSVQRVFDIALESDYIRRKAGTSGAEELYVPQMGVSRNLRKI